MTTTITNQIVDSLTPSKQQQKSGKSNERRVAQGGVRNEGNILPLTTRSMGPSFTCAEDEKRAEEREECDLERARIIYTVTVLKYKGTSPVDRSYIYICRIIRDDLETRIFPRNKNPRLFFSFSPFYSYVIKIPQKCG